MLEGEEWKEKRGEITPAFTNNRVSCHFKQSIYKLRIPNNRMYSI